MRVQIASAMLTVLLGGRIAGAELPAEFRTAEDAVAHGDVGSARHMAERLQSMTDANLRALGLVVIAEVTSAKEGQHASLSILHPLVAAPGRLHELDPDVQLAIAKALRCAGDLAGALDICNDIGEHRAGMTRAHAATAAADVLADMKEWDQALERLKLAAEVVWQADTSHVEGAYQWEIEQKRRRIQGVLDINKHGAGYYLYVLAQRARLEAKDYARARDGYAHLVEAAAKNRGNPSITIATPDDPRIDQLPVAPVYEEAARFYHTICLIALGDRSSATRELQAIVAGPASNHYWGESQRLLGDLALETTGDTAAAERCYSAALSWFADLAEHPLKGKAPQIPEQSQDITRPPNSMRASTDWGNVTWFQPRPEQVYNSDTCSWYLPYQSMLAQTRRALCRFLNGKTESAVADLDIITKTDPIDADLTANGLPSNYRRLHDDFLGKRLYATAAELAQFTGKPLAAVALADFAFEMEDWSSASAGYLHLIGDGTKLGTGARAYLTYALAECDVFQRKSDSAKQRLAGFHSEFLGTPTWPRAMLLEASLEMSDSCYALLESVVSRCPNSDFSREALLKIGQNHFVRGEYPEANKAFQRLKAGAAGTVYERGAAAYLDAISNHSQGKKP